MVERIASPIPLLWVLIFVACLMLALAGIACTPKTGNFIDDATYDSSGNHRSDDNRAILQTPDVLDR